MAKRSARTIDYSGFRRSQLCAAIDSVNARLDSLRPSDPRHPSALHELTQLRAALANADKILIDKWNGTPTAITTACSHARKTVARTHQTAGLRKTGVRNERKLPTGSVRNSRIKNSKKRPPSRIAKRAVSTTKVDRAKRKRSKRR
jgi:hypothetical protein